MCTTITLFINIICMFNFVIASAGHPNELKGVNNFSIFKKKLKKLFDV
jgi:hypothetical protein